MNIDNLRTLAGQRGLDGEKVGNGSGVGAAPPKGAGAPAANWRIRKPRAQVRRPQQRPIVPFNLSISRVGSPKING